MKKEHLKKVTCEACGRNFCCERFMRVHWAAEVFHDKQHADTAIKGGYRNFFYKWQS